MDSTASVANDGDTLSAEVNLGIIVGTVSQDTLVILATRYIGPSPVVQVSAGVDENIAFLHDVVADFAVCNALAGNDSPTAICVFASDNPLLFLIIPASAGNLATGRDVFSQVEFVDDILDIFENFWR